MTRLRTWRAAVLASLALSSTAVPAAAADAPRPEISATPMSLHWLKSLTAAPDGTMWALSQEHSQEAGAHATVVQRIDRDRVVSRVALPGAFVPGTQTLDRTPLTATADGGMAIVSARAAYGSEPPQPGDLVLARLAPGGGPVTVSSLPDAALRASGFAIAADGAVWFARLCEGALYRHVPGGATTVTRVPSATCDARQIMETSGVVLGPDGSVWIADLDQRTVVRVRVGERTRTWRLPASRCEVYYDGVPALLAEPRGGILFDKLPCAGRITAAGRVDFDVPYDGTGYVDADGIYWNGARRWAPSGWSRSGPLPAGMTGAVAVQARDGAPWAIGGRFHSEGYRETYDEWWTDVQVATIADGAAARWSLAEQLPSSDDRRSLNRVRATLGPDGAIYGYGEGEQEWKLLRVLPAGLSAPAAPRARLARTLGREGRTQWLLLACDAERGRYCRGTATLAGAGFAAQPAHFALAGRTTAAVAVVLGDRAARALGRRGALRTTAIVRAVDVGTTRRTITLRRAR